MAASPISLFAGAFSRQVEVGLEFFYVIIDLPSSTLGLTFGHAHTHLLNGKPCGWQQTFVFLLQN
jgi:hypothetical protein